MKIKGIWISWEFQRRNYGISSALGFDFHEINIKRSRLIRYYLSTIKTWSVISTNTPDIIVAQNPSIILAILVVLLQKFYHYRVIIDAHNSGIYPREGKSYALLHITKWLQKKSDLTLVTNSEMQAVVESNGGNAYILPDKIPIVPTHPTTPLSRSKSVALICTFSIDEPYQHVIKAANLINSDICIYITGKHTGKVDLKNLPCNIKLLGFISENDYWALLQSSDIIMDLTLREGCLVCGAYEALAVNKPLILSNTKVTKRYFSDGCVYVDPTPESIANGIIYALNNLAQLKKGISRLKSNLYDDWDDRLKKLNCHLLNIVNPEKLN